MSILTPIGLWDPTHLASGGVAEWWSIADLNTKRLMPVSDGSGGFVFASWKGRVAGIAPTATGTARPTYAATGWDGTLPAITFNGTSQCFDAETGTFGALPTGTASGGLYAVVGGPGGSTDGTLRTPITYGSTTTGAFRRLTKSAGDAWNVSDGATSTANGIPSPLDLPPASLGNHCIAGMFGATTYQFRYDGAIGPTPLVHSVNTGGGTLRLRIGASNLTSASQFHKGKMREILVLGRELTADEWSKLDGWAMWSCGLQASLPAGHPYLSAPPKLYSANALRVLWSVGNGPIITNAPVPPPSPTIPPPPPVPDPPPPMQDETVAWLARLPGTAAPDPSIVTPYNTFVARLKSSGMLAQFTDVLFHGGGTIESATEGLLGHYTHAAGTLNGNVPDLNIGVGMTFDGASYWSTGVNYATGKTLDKFGLAMFLTSNVQGFTNWVGARTDTINQVALRGSEGIRTTCQLANGTRTFGDSNSVNATGACQYSTTGAIGCDGSSDSQAAVVTDFAQTPAALPNVPLELGRDGTPATLSIDTGLVTIDGWWTPDQWALLDGYLVELAINLGIWSDIQVPPIPSGPNAWGDEDLPTVTPSVSAPTNFRIFKLRGPPANTGITKDTFAGGPATDWITREDHPEDLAVGPVGHVAYMWVPRKDVVTSPPESPTTARKPNDTQPTIARMVGTRSYPCRQTFVSDDNAIGSFLAQHYWHSGLTSGTDPAHQSLADLMTQYGLNPSNIMTNAVAAAQKDTLFTTLNQGFYTCSNVVVTDNNRQCDLTNYLRYSRFADEENASNRTAAKCVEMHARAAQITRAMGAEYFVGALILNESNGFRSGFTLDSCWQLMANSNITGCPLLADHRQKTGTIIDSVQASVALYKGPLGDKTVDYTRFFFMVNKGRLSTAITEPEAWLLRTWMLDHGIKYIFPANAGASFGGDPSLPWNRVEAILLGLPLS